MTSSRRLADAVRDLEKILNRGNTDMDGSPCAADPEARHETHWVTMRDGVKLATDVFLPSIVPAPAIAMRTPYGRCAENLTSLIRRFARCGYVVIAQDCRGTGDSEPDTWDFGVYEGEDGYDLVEWVSRQHWFNGYLFAFGGSYVAGTQWCMASHPRMSAIAPEVAGLGTTRRTARRYMFVNAYPRVIGKGLNRVSTPITEIERLIEPETMAGGYFNEPLPSPLPEAVLQRYPKLGALPECEAKRALWAEYCALPAAGRADLLKVLLGVSEFSYAESGSLPYIFDCLIPYGLHMLPSVDAGALCRRFNAPALMITGWYDWNLRDALSGWETLRRKARREVASNSRLIVTPAAHHAPGYHEGEEGHPELRQDHRSNVSLLLRWYEAVQDEALESWPRVIFYLMGANEWRTCSDWPVPEARGLTLYLDCDGKLVSRPPGDFTPPDRYTYDPTDPTPTVGGSVLSFLYPAGSVDVSTVQKRTDVLTYTTAPLERDLDVAGPLRLILYASSSAVDTDFAARLSDVFPDGRAIQLQNGILRARYRNLTGEPELLEPGRIYRLEIDLWATANRFKAGHRLRLDVSSADFPRYDRNSNLGGKAGPPVPALQCIYHDPDHPSHLFLSVLPG